MVKSSRVTTMKDTQSPTRVIIVAYRPQRMADKEQGGWISTHSGNAHLGLATLPEAIADYSLALGLDPLRDYSYSNSPFEAL